MNYYEKYNNMLTAEAVAKTLKVWKETFPKIVDYHNQTKFKIEYPSIKNAKTISFSYYIDGFFRRSRKCECKLQILMANGCQCGGI